ncbi:MAG: riboflavin kinase [Rikenellaceae bacterium]
MIVRGVVVEGKKLGRKLGFPTANILISEDLNVSNGVYRSEVKVAGTTYRAITNVGNNPTTGVVSRRVESYIFDFKGDIYGQIIGVSLIAKIRGEIKFESIEMLRAQVLKDIELVKGRE